MTAAPKRLSVSEFAIRAVARVGRGDWLVLVVPEEQVGQVASRVKAEVEVLGDSLVEHVKGPMNARDLAESIHSAERGEVVVASGVDHFENEEWRHVDLLRSRFGREGIVVLVMCPRSIGNLCREAPHLASWIGGSIWEADVTSDLLSDEEKAARLKALREWANLGDD